MVRMQTVEAATNDYCSAEHRTINVAYCRERLWLNMALHSDQSSSRGSGEIDRTIGEVGEVQDTVHRTSSGQRTVCTYFPSS